jgi:MFS family permease
VVARAALGHVRRDPVYRDLLLSRAGLTLWASCFPFVVLLAVRDLGGGTRAAGTFLLARMFGQVASNLGWQALARRSGTTAVMRAATLVAGACALGAALVAVASPHGAGWIGAGAAVPLLALLAVAGGAAQSGTVMSYSGLMLELAPEGERPMFVGLLNTVMALSMVLPPLAGALVDRIGAAPVFALCAAGAIPCHLAARRLPRAAR